MRNPLPLLPLLLLPACTHSTPISTNPLQNAPTHLSFSTANPQIYLETSFLLVSTKTLKNTPLFNSQPTTDPITIDPAALPPLLAQLAPHFSTLANPRLNLTSGQPASFALTQSLNYMKSAQPPQPATLTTGLTLDLTATIAPDGNTILTSLHPTYTHLNGIDTFTTNTPNAKSAGPFTQIPHTTTAQFTTTTSIPNNQILILQSSPITVESEGYSGGLFPNRYFLRDEATLLLILHPTITPPPKTAAATPPNQNPT